MSFNFTVKEFLLGNGTGTPTLQFYKRGFELNGGGESPSWQDIILSGNTALTLTNALANGLNYLKLFGATEQRNLPSEYTQVEYLESSGKEYIDLGDNLDTSTDDIEIEMQLLTTDEGTSFFGARGSTTQNPYTLGCSTEYWRWGWKYTSDYTSVATDTNKHTFRIDHTSQTLSLDGNVIDTRVRTGNITTPTTPILFGIHATSAQGLYLGAVRISAFRRWRSGELVQLVVACRRNSDNVLGMYDLVTGDFLINQGTGSFTAGADVTVPTPTNPMDVVCNNGVVKVNTEASGRNAIDTSDTEQGYLNSTIEQPPSINSSSVSMVIKNAIKVSNGKKYKFSYYSNLAVNREINFVNNNGIVTFKQTPNCVVGLNEYIVESDTDGYLWLTVQSGDLATVKPVAYEIGEIYTDGTVETVEITGNNLFDKTTVASGYRLTNVLNKEYGTIGNTFDFISANDCFVSALIPVEVGKTYIKNSPSEDAYHRYRIYDANQMSVRMGNENSITIQSGEAYIAFCGYLTELDSTTLYDSAISIQTATAENLFKVGDYKDEQEVLTGSVTRNVGIKVLDGTEDWTRQTGTYPYFCVDYDTDFALSTNTYGGFCSHFECVNTGATQNNQGISMYRVASTGTTRLGLKYNNLYPATDANIPLLKQWLADQYANGTPVIIVYPLATATTETVTGQPLTTQVGTNIVEITQASIDNLGLEVSYKATV